MGAGFFAWSVLLAWLFFAALAEHAADVTAADVAHAHRSMATWGDRREVEP